MTAILAFLTANAGVILAAVFAILNVLVAVFSKNERATGIIGTIRTVIERLAVLQPRDSAGTVKLPGAPAAPKNGPTPIMGE